MRVINLKAFPDHLWCEDREAGYEGEHYQTKLAVFLDKALIGDYVYCLRFCTSRQAKQGGMSVTGQIKEKNGLLIFSLPKELTVAGELRMQLIVSQGENRIFSPVLKGGLIIRKAEKAPPVLQETVVSNMSEVPVFTFADMLEFASKQRCVMEYIRTHEGVPDCGGRECTRKENGYGNMYGQHYVM